MRARYDRARNVVRNNAGAEFKHYILTPGDGFSPKARGKFTPRKLKPGEKEVKNVMHYGPRAEVVKKEKKSAVKVGKLIRVLPGGNHALFESNVGPIRKPIQK